MADEDPNISVSITDDQMEHCIEVDMGTWRFTLHARSAVDLHRKLGLTLCDWIGQTVGELIQR